MVFPNLITGPWCWIFTPLATLGMCAFSRRWFSVGVAVWRVIYIEWLVGHGYSMIAANLARKQSSADWRVSVLNL